CAGLACLTLAYHLGADRAAARPADLNDVAIATGILNDGELIPLPTYGDGTPALESECRWTVSLNQGQHQSLPESETCTTEGRVVRAASCDPPNSVCTSRRPEKANYIIIAMRRR